MLDRPGYDLSRNALCPIAICQEAVDHVQIKPRRIGADEEFVATVLDDRIGTRSLCGLHLHILNCKPRRTRSYTKKSLMDLLREPSCPSWLTLCSKRGPQERSQLPPI